MFTNLVCARTRSWRTRSFLPCRDVEEADDADADDEEAAQAARHDADHQHVGASVV